MLRVGIIAGNVKDGLNGEVVGDCLGGNCKWSCTLSLYFMYFFCYKAGKKTTDEELEEMLESGNPAIFTSGVSGQGTHVSAQGRARVGCVCSAAGEGTYGDSEGCAGASLFRVVDSLSVWDLL